MYMYICINKQQIDVCNVNTIKITINMCRDVAYN